MKLSLLTGDITEAEADAICTSTNPRLTLMMGTGGAVRDRGGWDVLRAAEKIVAEEESRTGRKALPPGSAWVTTAGTLPFKVIIHCVASSATHLSSAEVIRACVKSALRRAEEAGCATVAMPVFGTGHARFRFDRAVAAMAETLRDTPSAVREVIIVVADEAKAAIARKVLGELEGTL